jgi:hypothetical protein
MERGCLFFFPFEGLPMDMVSISNGGPVNKWAIKKSDAALGASRPEAPESF